MAGTDVKAANTWEKPNRITATADRGAEDRGRQGDDSVAAAVVYDGVDAVSSACSVALAADNRRLDDCRSPAIEHGNSLDRLPADALQVSANVARRQPTMMRERQVRAARACIVTPRACTPRWRSDCNLLNKRYSCNNQISLDGPWDFQFDPADSADVAAITTWRTAKVPLPWQAQFDDLRQASGTAWYRRDFTWQGGAGSSSPRKPP